MYNYFNKVYFREMDIMNGIKLVKPSNKYIGKIKEFKKELIDNNSNFEGCGFLEDYDLIEDWINYIKQNELGLIKDRVPSSIYLGLREKDEKLIGIIDIRHHIDNPILKEWGGYIGYIIRPSEQRKGYGTEILKQGLIICQNMDMDKLLLVCNSKNIGSEKVIIKNGGVFEKEIPIGDKIMKRYWIKLN